METNIVIDNTIICNDFMDLDFANMNIGQQIIVLKSGDTITHNNREIRYNDFDIYLLKDQCIKNAYWFDKIETNINVDRDTYYDDGDCLEIQSHPELDSCYYVKIKQDLLKIHDMELYCMDNDEFVEYDKHEYNYNKFNELYSNTTGEVRSTFYNTVINKEQYNVRDYFLIDLAGSFLGICIENKIASSKYTWEKEIDYYLFDNEFNKVAILDLTKRQSLQLINIINKNYPNSSKQCVMNLTMYSFSLNDLRTSSSNKQLAITVLSNHDIYNANDIIDKFLDIVYFDETFNIKCYLKNINFGNHPMISCDDFKISNDPDIRHKQEQVLQKATSVLKHLTCTSLIDIYTGEVVNHSYEKSYEDYEYLRLRNKRTNSTVYFKKVDNELYIELKFSSERGEAFTTIQERQNICNSLIK